MTSPYDIPDVQARHAWYKARLREMNSSNGYLSFWDVGAVLRPLMEVLDHRQAWMHEDFVEHARHPHVRGTLLDLLGGSLYRQRIPCTDVNLAAFQELLFVVNMTHVKGGDWSNEVSFIQSLVYMPTLRGGYAIVERPWWG